MAFTAGLDLVDDEAELPGRFGAITLVVVRRQANIEQGLAHLLEPPGVEIADVPLVPGPRMGQPPGPCVGSLVAQTRCTLQGSPGSQRAPSWLQLAPRGSVVQAGMLGP